MKVSGFSFIRNAIVFDYPIVEAICSILPLCDEVIIAVGQSDDATLELVQSIDNQKIKIIETVWDDSLRQGGKVLAQETDKAFKAISPEADWAFYIQGDEVLHESGLNKIRNSMEQFKDDAEIDGLLFDYLHFYGSFDYVGESWRWYRREIRIIKNDPSIYSYRDAQGFRKGNGKKLRVKPSGGTIHHYGWVKPPMVMQCKQLIFNKLWHDDHWVESNIPKATEWDYQKVDALSHFDGTHPSVIKNRVEQQNWNFNFDTKKNRFSWKEMLKRRAANLTGFRFGEYKNYLLVND
jgi:glycosyltransferase involved in cell wall biosynthesis